MIQNPPFLIWAIDKNVSKICVFEQTDWNVQSFKISDRSVFCGGMEQFSTS